MYDLLMRCNRDGCIIGAQDVAVEPMSVLMEVLLFAFPLFPPSKVKSRLSVEWARRAV